MISYKTIFDGEKVIVPDALRGHPPGEVILIVQNGSHDASDTSAWMKAQEAGFAAVWDNDEDAAYDAM